jgi:DNA-binding transcriptional LysR family regulator
MPAHFALCLPRARLEQRIGQRESDVRHSLIAFARTGQGIAVVPSNGVIGGRELHAAPVVFRGESVGKWSVIAWHPERYLQPYAHWFVEAMVPYAARHNPGRAYIRRAPAMPKPKEQSGFAGSRAAR